MQGRNWKKFTTCHDYGASQTTGSWTNGTASGPKANLITLVNRHFDDVWRPMECCTEATTRKATAKLLGKVSPWRKCEDINEQRDWCSALLTGIQPALISVSDGRMDRKSIGRYFTDNTLLLAMPLATECKGWWRNSNCPYDRNVKDGTLKCGQGYWGVAYFKGGLFTAKVSQFRIFVVWRLSIL